MQRDYSPSSPEGEDKDEEEEFDIWLIEILEFLLFDFLLLADTSGLLLSGEEFDSRLIEILELLLFKPLLLASSPAERRNLLNLYFKSPFDS